MKKDIFHRMQAMLRFCVALFFLAILSLFLFSFKAEKQAADFLKQLGLSQEQANSKITGSLLAGSLDLYGIRNLHKILVNDRAAIVNDLAGYAKQYANSAAFKNEYTLLRENNKPAPAQKTETPEEMRASMIKSAKEYLKNAEDAYKKAGPDMKNITAQMLDAAKQNLKAAEDPANKSIIAYTRNYESLKKIMQQSNENMIKIWEENYPADHLQYIRVKLQSFMDATADIDFNAQLTEKNGIKYFVNPDYERKGNRWKLAFRAGKSAVETARAFAGKWISEIN